MLVSNPATHDNRVIKQAESLSDLGYDVTLYCYGTTDENRISFKNGVKYNRVPIINGYKIIISKLIEITTKNHEALMGMPLVSHIALASCIALSIIIAAPLFIIDKCINFFRNAVTTPKKVSWAYKAKKFLIQKILRQVLLPIMHLLIFLSFYNELNEDEYDIVHVHDLDTALTGKYFAKKKKVKLVYDAHELETDRDDRSEKLSKFLSKTHERIVAQNAQQIITVSDKIARRIEALYDLKNPVHTILNSPRSNSNGLPDHSIKDDIGVSDQDFLSTYVGILAHGRNLETTIKTLKYLPQWHHIALIGPAQEKYVQTLKSCIKEHKLDGRVHICQPVSLEILLDYISSSNAGLILSDLLCDSFKYAMPNKLFEMSFAGLPLVVSNLESIREYVETNSIGIVVNGVLDEKNIANAILELEKNYSRFKPDPNKVESMKKRYGWERQEEILENIYKNL